MTVVGDWLWLDEMEIIHRQFAAKRMEMEKLASLRTQFRRRRDSECTGTSNTHIECAFECTLECAADESSEAGIFMV